MLHKASLRLRIRVVEIFPFICRSSLIDAWEEVDPTECARYSCDWFRSLFWVIIDKRDSEISAAIQLNQQSASLHFDRSQGLLLVINICWEHKNVNLNLRRRNDRNCPWHSERQCCLNRSQHWMIHKRHSISGNSCDILVYFTGKSTYHLRTR